VQVFLSEGMGGQARSWSCWRWPARHVWCARCVGH